MRTTAFFYFFLMLITPSVLIAQRTDLAQLEVQYKASPTAERADALLKAYQEQAAWFKRSPQFDVDSVFFYYKKAIDWLESESPIRYELLAESYSNISEFSLRASELIQATAQADKAMFYFQQCDKRGTQLKMLEFGIRDVLADCYVRENPEYALKLIEPAWQLLQDDKSPEIQAKLLRSKGLFYSYYFDSSFEKDVYVNQSLKKAVILYESSPKTAYSELLFKVYEALMWDYGALNKTDSCDFYFDKMKKLLPLLKNPLLDNRYHSLRGNALSRRKQYAEAKIEIEKSLNLCATYKLRHSTIYGFNHNLMGVIAMNQGQYDTAATYFKTAYELAMRFNHNDKKSFFEHMSELNIKKRDFEQALYYYKIYSDSVIAGNNRGSLEKLGKSELKLNILSQEKELNQKRTQQRVYTTLLGFSVLLLCLLYRNARLKQKNNQTLAQLNTDLANKNTLLDKRNAENELLLKEIHHRVKNNLEVVSSLLALQSAQINDPSVQDAMQASQNRVQSMGILHQKLYQSEHLAFIEMKHYFMNLSENILDSYNATDRIKIELPMTEVELDVDTAVPIGLIVNELLTNSLKYAFEKNGFGTVRLSLVEKEKDVFELQIADNGIGKNLNTNTAQGTGFGTQLVALLTQQLDGKLRQEVKNGTSISIEFKRAKAA